MSKSKETIENLLSRVAHYVPASTKVFDSVSRTYFQYKFSRETPSNKPPVVIYQMGKVGSSTLLASLNETQHDYPVFHIHNMSRQFLESSKQSNRPIKSRHYWESYYLKKQLESHPDSKWKVITIVREPVGRNISAFFQNINWLFPNLNARLASGELTLDDVIEGFFSTYNHDVPLTWFDEQLNAELGVDVFSRPFDFEQGFTLFERDGIEVLVLRLEDFNTHAADAIKQFLGLESFVLTKRNDGGLKSYRDVYDEFRKRVRFPVSYLDRMYDSKYAQHFYRNEELKAFRRNWE